MSEPPVVERDPREWLTVEEVSRELAVHQVTVRDWLNRGLLVGSKAGRRRWRIRRQALETFLERDRATGRQTTLPPDPYVPPTGYAAAVIDTLSGHSS